MSRVRDYRLGFACKVEGPLALGLSRRRVPGTGGLEQQGKSSIRGGPGQNTTTGTQKQGGWVRQNLLSEQCSKVGPGEQEGFL